MGFDNECILNIQSLAGEYFCPVCRTLVYPHEALQTQCTHLYCKPCLSYVVGSTQACPYDGYLVTEAGSKPLLESNKALAETIGKTTVHCLYHRSGCTWQGPLSDSTTHCFGCAFGNSPVVCNRCGIQIVHRQVQEHAQICNVNGANSQPQGTGQDAAASGVSVPTDQSKITNQAVAAPPSQPQGSVAQSLSQPAAAIPQPQTMPVTAVPTPEQQYYQQYYQQYPGYDQYQQGYQQYYPYQQQPPLQFQGPQVQQPQLQGQQVQQPQLQSQQVQQPQLQSQQVQQPQLQQQVQAPMQLPPQVQPQQQPQNPPLTQAQGQVQLQPQPHSQAQPLVPSNGPPQPLYPQQGQVNSQQQPHGHMPPQSYSQVQPHPVQNYPQSHMQVPQYQQPLPQIHHPQPAQVQPQPHQPHPQFNPQVQLQPMNPQHPPAHQHALPLQQHTMQVQHPPTGSLPPAQFLPPPPPHMRPPQPPHMFPPQHQVQQPMPPQYMQQPQAISGQPSGQLQGQLHHSGSFAQQNSQVRPPGPPQPMQQPSFGFGQPQHGTASPHVMPSHTSQNHLGRPPMLNQGIAPPHARPPQFGPSQPSVNQSNLNVMNQPHVYSEQQNNQFAPPERRVEQQEDKSSSLKKHEPVANDFVANFNDVKPDVSAMNSDHKPGNEGAVDQRKDEALTKNAVSELHGDSVITQRVKEERKDGALDYSPRGNLNQNRVEDGGVAKSDSVKQEEKGVNFQGSSEVNNGNLQGPLNGRDGNGNHHNHISDVTGGFPSKATEQSSHYTAHPPVPYGLSDHQQRPPYNGPPVGQPPNHLRPTGHGYLPHAPHPGEQPLGSHPPGPFQDSFGGLPVPGANSFPNNSRVFEPPSRFSRMSQGEPLGPPLSSAPHVPHGQSGPHHSGHVEFDLYQNQRPPHLDSRRPDSHLPGNLERGQYGPPFSVESNSMILNGAPPPGYDSSSAPIFHDDKFRNRNHEQDEFKGNLRQFPGPAHLGNEGSPKFGSHSSRPLGGYGMDGPSRFFDKDSHGYGYHSAGDLHPGEFGRRPLPANIYDDNRGRFDNNRHNPDFPGPMHSFGQHHMDRFPPSSPRNPSRPFGGPHNIDLAGREMERHPFDERFPMGPPGHMHRGEFDGPRKPRTGEPFGFRNVSGQDEPRFGSFQDYDRAGERNGPVGFPHQPPFGESFGTKSTRPHMGEPGFRSSYSRQGFSSDGGFYAGGPDSFDHLRKRKTGSTVSCRICKIDCETVEGLDMHGQTREHQRMAMDMVITIKQKNAKKLKTSNDRSLHEEASKLRNVEVQTHANMS